MTHPLLSALIWLTAAFFTAAALLAWLKRPVLARWCGRTGILGNLLGVATLTWLARRPPLYGPVEGVLFVSLVAVLLAAGTRLPGGRSVLSPPWVWTPSALLMLMLLTRPLILNEDFYMYSDPWVAAFFNLRLAAAAVYLHAGLLLFAAGSPGDRATRFHLARNWVLVGATAYLTSEFAGSVWCLRWWGDYWHWSKGFFMAAIMFLLVMMGVHLPARWNVSRGVRGLILMVPLGLILWQMFFHQA